MISLNLCFVNLIVVDGTVYMLCDGGVLILFKVIVWYRFELKACCFVRLLLGDNVVFIEEFYPGVIIGYDHGVRLKSQSESPRKCLELCFNGLGLVSTFTCAKKSLHNC